MPQMNGYLKPFFIMPLIIKCLKNFIILFFGYFLLLYIISILSLLNISNVIITYDIYSKYEI